jgi:predicted RNA binding protein YcfA (HicA-like mRNA interferase family)
LILLSLNWRNEMVIKDKIKCPFRKLHVTTKKLKYFISSIGFNEISRTGSHIKYRNKNSNKTCTFANKKDSHTYKIGTLKKILKDYDESLENIRQFTLKVQRLDIADSNLSQKKFFGGK